MGDHEQPVPTEIQEPLEPKIVVELTAEELESGDVLERDLASE